MKKIVSTVILLSVSCLPSSAWAQVACSAGFCENFGTPVTTGNVETSLLNEISGLAASLAHPGVLFSHNDSGDTPRFFAKSTAGAHLGIFNVTNASAIDWEDMALGPCPSGSCVYIGDIGDNGLSRTTKSVYRVAEPNVSVGQAVGTVSVSAERFQFNYPAGTKYNAETLLVHPESADVYVVTKHAAGTPSKVFKFPQPLDAATVATLIYVTTLDAGTADREMTGGDIHPCGSKILLRTYGKLYEFTVPTGGTFEQAFNSPYRTVPVAAETQGEAVTWASDGKGYFTVSEGSYQGIHYSTCALAGAPVTTKFLATADAMVSKDFPTKNYGNSTTFKVDGAEPNGSSVSEAYIKFSVGTLSGTMQSAKLRIYGKTTSGPISVRLAGSTWSEGSINWNNRPLTSAPALSSNSCTVANTWIEFDVTTAVTQSGNLTFDLYTSQRDGMLAASKNGGKTPELIVITK